jgi:hypothetical protein
MNKQLKIKTRQFGRNIVILPIGFVVMLVLGGPSVQAQTTAPAAVVDSSVTLAAKGSVSDPNGAITVTGNVIVNCRRVLDTTTTTNATMAPVVLLDLDFSQLRGTSGTAKTLKTYVTGDNHASELRPFQASDTIIVTSPYFDSTNSALSARSMLVTATLNFDVNTGKLVSGSISIGNNIVTSATVGTITATP